MDFVSEADKPLVWLHGEVKTPPFSKEARVEAGVLLRRLHGVKSSACLLRGRCRPLDAGVTS
jgi:hypothetical protein